MCSTFQSATSIHLFNQDLTYMHIYVFEVSWADLGKVVLLLETYLSGQSRHEHLS